MVASVRNRLIVSGITLLLAILLLLPTLFPSTFSSNWISKKLALGLDLRGGAHLVYEVDVKEAIKGRLLSMGQSIRSELRENNVPVFKVAANDSKQLELTLLSARNVEKVQDQIAKLPELSFVEKREQGEGRVQLVYGLTEQRQNALANEALNQAIETLRSRVDQFGVAEPLIQKTGTNRLLLQMPGETDIEKVKKTVGKVAKLEFRLVPRSGQDSASSVLMDHKNGSKIAVEDTPLMTGASVKWASTSFHDGKLHVALTLTSEGAKTFGEITARNVGRQLAIIFDGEVYSDPVINEPIFGGQADISGRFTREEAEQLRIVLRSGALPAPLIVREERSVGPSLGKDSIDKGVIGIAVGFAFIGLFMSFWYKKAGVLATALLGLNLVLMLSLLTLFGATMTLPGLAGLALTVGMAVDSNVIIFERIKDELKLGATRDAAVHAGFDKAFSAIFDSNLTTFLAGAILYAFGTGPIRGFAVTLSAGIVTTVFCATFVTRLGFELLPLRAGNRAGAKVLSI